MNVIQMKHIHFVGIKGIAMAALAVYCKERGIKVTGSDIDEEFPSDEVLKAISVSPDLGFDPANILKDGKPDLVIYTGAHKGRDNAEVACAVRLGIPVLPHGKALGKFMEGHRQISVAGCHGKTTTTAMIASILIYAGLDPSYAIGSGMVAGLGLPGHSGKGECFIAEADEYITEPGYDATPRFLWQNPEILVITNIDFDHPDAYGSMTEVKEAYSKLVNQVPNNGLLIISKHDENSRDVSYGNIERIDVNPQLSLSVPGKHNALNAAMAATVARHVGVSWEVIKHALKNFGGAKRRFEFVGSVGRVSIYDDYAHHPKEISSTLTAAREWFGKQRIIVVFQPHTYSRTNSLLKEFSEAFADGDVVILTDIYASARETKPEAPVLKHLVELTRKHVKNLYYVKDYDACVEFLKKEKRVGDIIITMGAGDIYGWGRRFLHDFG